MEPEHILDQLRSLVLRVEGVAQGTGYLARQDLVVTCRHVAGPAGSHCTAHYDGPDNGPTSTITATVIHADEAIDFAILQLDKPIRGIRPFRAAAKLSPGDRWWSVGFPSNTNNNPFTIQGEITQPNGRDDKGRKKLQLFSKQLASGSGFSPHGASGSPVVTEHGMAGFIDRIIIDPQGLTAGSPRAEAGTVFALPYLDIASTLAAVASQDNPNLTRLLRDVGNLPGQFVIGALDPDLDVLASLDTLRGQIKNKMLIDHYYLYLGPHCANNWIQLTHYGQYGHNLNHHIDTWLSSEAVRSLYAHLATHSDPETGCSVISLGCGDGRLDSLLLQRLQDASVRVSSYLPVDMSFELLQQAVRTTLRVEALRHVGIHPIYADITRLLRVRGLVKASQLPEVFTMLGYTLSNYELRVLEPLREVMGPEDALLVDARCYEQEDSTIESGISPVVHDSVKKAYHHRRNESFAFGPISNFTRKSVRGRFGYTIERDSSSRVRNAVSVATHLNLDDELRDELELDREAQRLQLARSRTYRKKDLSAWFLDLGFKILYEVDIPQPATNLRHALFMLVRSDPA